VFVLTTLFQTILTFLSYSILGNKAGACPSGAPFSETRVMVCSWPCPKIYNSKEKKFPKTNTLAYSTVTKKKRFKAMTPGPVP
jgi:hypothetical protein